MTEFNKARTDPSAARQGQMLRLASYKAMQRRLDLQRRQLVSRQRILALRGDARFGWIAL